MNLLPTRSESTSAIFVGTGILGTWVQTAYQILVASTLDLLETNQADLWDSGRTPASVLHLIEYVGKPPERVLEGSCVGSTGQT